MWVFQSSCPSTQPLLPNSHQSKQNWADSETLQFKINLTQSTSRWDTLYSSYLLMRYVASREFESKYKVVDARNEFHIVSVATKCEKEANGLT